MTTDVIEAIPSLMVQTRSAPERDAFAYYDTAWLRAWEQAFLPGNGWSGPLEIHDVSAQGKIAFARQNISILKVRSLAGYYWPYRTLALDVPGKPAAFARDVAEYLTGRLRGMAVRLGPVFEADQLMGNLFTELKQRGWRAMHRESGAMFELELPADFATFQETASKSMLKNITYLRRRMTKEEGEIRVERHVLGAGSEGILATLAALEKRSWVGLQNGDLKFAGERNQRFWNLLANAGKRSASAVIWLLWCKDQPIAFSAHLESGSSMHIIANGFDEAWKRFSPGSILTHDIFATECGRIKRVDWGQGDSGYKRRWGAQGGAALTDVLLLKPGLVGAPLHYAAQRLLKGWQSGFPQRV